MKAVVVLGVFLMAVVVPYAWAEGADEELELKENWYLNSNLVRNKRLSQKVSDGIPIGSNREASQSGMSGMQIADFEADDASRKGQAVTGSQAGSNREASESGMSTGTVRHIAVIKEDDASRKGPTVIGPRIGSNSKAGQSGMSTGAVRHIADIKEDDASRKGQTVIGSQAGSNK